MQKIPKTCSKSCRTLPWTCSKLYRKNYQEKHQIQSKFKLF